MLNKLAKLHVFVLAISTFFVGCASKKNIENNNEQNPTMEVQNSLEVTNSSDFADQELNYQIKKLNSEINYLKDQLMELDVKSSLYADPFDVYSKEIILNNGSSIFCKILSQNDTEIFVETLIGNLTLDRSSVVRIVENITVLDEERWFNLIETNS